MFADGTGKDLYSPEAESSPAISFVDPALVTQVAGVATKPTSRTSSFEIENLLKTAEQVSKPDMTTNTWPKSSTGLTVGGMQKGSRQNKPSHHNNS